MRALIFGLFITAAVIGWKAGDRSAPAVTAPVTTAEDWRTPHQSGGEITLSRDEGGHFFVTGDVGGTSIRFVVDTGATDVALGREDARRLGIMPDHFDLQLRTASGTIMGAMRMLPRLRIGDIQLLGVRAVVLDIPETVPMLGQSFLARLDRVVVEGDRMTLTKR